MDAEQCSGSQSKGARIEENYTKTFNFIAYLKDITTDKETPEVVRADGEEPEDVDGIGNESGELEAVWKYLDNFYELEEDGTIKWGRNPLPIKLDDKTSKIRLSTIIRYGWVNSNTFDIYFNLEFQAINTECLPDLKTINSTGSIVVLEFFTHCCINCIHSIEDVREVFDDLRNDARSQWVGNELKIISIHSPKFTREKDLESIKAFAEQLQMDYSDVVNDPGCLLWNELGISCWPTLLILGPNPTGNGMNLLFTMMGEGHKHVLRLILSSAVPYFRHKLRNSDDTTDGVSGPRQTVIISKDSSGRDRQTGQSILRYPGMDGYYTVN